MCWIRLIPNCLGLTAAFLTASASRPAGIIIRLSTRQRALRSLHLKSGKKKKLLSFRSPSFLCTSLCLWLHLPHRGNSGVASSRAERRQQRFIATDGGVAVVTTLLWRAAASCVPLQLRLYISGRGPHPGTVLAWHSLQLCAQICACAQRGAHFITDTRAQAFARKPMLTRAAWDVNVTLSPCFMSGAAQQSVKIKHRREGRRGWKMENIPQTTSWPEFDLLVSVAVLQLHASANFLA